MTSPSRPGRPGHASTPLPEPTIRLTQGWHSLHLYYRVNPAALAGLSEAARREGCERLVEVLAADRPDAPQRLQVSIVSGHRADLGLMLLDPDPLKIDAVHQAVRSSTLGPVLEPTYSFVSITEVSEYVPTVEQYSERLRLDGTPPDDPAYAAKVRAYEQRLPMMNNQRLYPDFPNWPVTCFYPMNKIRDPRANWYELPFSERSGLMAEHATSGIKFAGKVSQLITASTGFDDWEWGVTLWARAPEYIKEIVYTMRFDRASARYAEFGPFYIGYIMTADEALRHLRLKP
jgi:chlorite dismutase